MAVTGVQTCALPILAEFSSNLCADAGYHAIADQIEFYGKIMIMAVSLPILLTLVDTIATI